MELTVNERIGNNVEVMEKVKLKELCSMQSGGTPSRGKSEYYNGTIPWSKISDLEKSNDGNIYKTEEHITIEGLKSINNRLFKKGTLLLAMYGSVGKTAIAEIELSTNQAILGLNIKDETKLDIKYLRFWFTTIKEKLLDRAVGGTLQNISMGIVKDLEIPLPNLPTQQKIAAILDKADELRQYNKQLIEKYDALTKSLFLEMFGDPVRNEKGWEIKKLGDITDLITDGKHGNCNDESGSGYYFVSAKDIRNNKINYINSREIPKLEFEEVDKRTNLQSGDLVMINTGATIGRMAIAKDIPETRRSTFQKSVAVIKVKKDVISSFFLQFVIELGLKSFANMGSGSAIKNLLLSEMRRFNIIIPNLNLQNQFAERIQIIETQKQQAQEALAKSEDLFQSLLQRAFKGELV